MENHNSNFANQENVVCPVCSRKGQKVKNETVKGTIINKTRYIEGSSYYQCLNPNCMVAYYDANDNTICESNLKTNDKGQSVH